MKTVKSFCALILTLVLVFTVVGCGSFKGGESSVCSTMSENLQSNNMENVIVSEEPKDEQTENQSIKILAIGNSFSVDGMHYLWDILNDAGYTEIILGNLYIGGCPITKHWNNIKNDQAAYVYYKNTYGKWKTTENTAISFAINEHDWDIITLQQNSANSGKPSTYGDVNNVFKYIKEQQPDAKVYWHMTWAYQQDRSSNDFAYYGSKQINMYNAIISTITEKIVDNSFVDGIIPCGTAIQNLRSSYIGDVLTRDGYHLSYSYGRYIAALTWFAALADGDVDIIDWCPDEYSEISGDLAVIRQSVKDAIDKPLEITRQVEEK